MGAFAKKLEQIAKKAAFAALGAACGSRREISAAALCDVSRIIVVRPNYRIGNAILATAVIEPLRARFPGAQIDFLLTDQTAVLFENLPVNEVAAVSRSAILRPWRTLSLLRRLRARHYDLAVQLAPSSLSGLVIASMLGARYVMGKPKGDADWYDVKVTDPIVNAYDVGPAFSTALGTAGTVSTQLALSGEEMRRALGQLQALGLSADSEEKVEPFIAVFVGGHADKVCPLSFWLALINDLNQAGQRFVVFVGPEEAAMIRDLQQALETLPHGTLCPPQPLRIFAGMLGRARLMITPDSGPMHMAAALKVPVVAMVRTRKSLAFVPPGATSHIVWDFNVPSFAVANQIPLI